MLAHVRPLQVLIYKRDRLPFGDSINLTAELDDIDKMAAGMSESMKLIKEHVPHRHKVDGAYHDEQ